MSTVYNKPNLRYIIETSKPGGDVLEYWAIDQACANPNDRRSVERIENQVERQLHYLHVKTGLTYKRLWSGHPSTVERYTREFRIELS